MIESNQPKKPIPPGLHGGDRRSAGARSSSQNENLKAFVADIAVKTGKGRSTVALVALLEAANRWFFIRHQLPL